MNWFGIVFAFGIPVFLAALLAGSDIIRAIERHYRRNRRKG